MRLARVLAFRHTVALTPLAELYTTEQELSVGLYRMRPELLAGLCQMRLEQQKTSYLVAQTSWTS